MDVADDRQCPDSAYCHHGCALTECFRVRTCAPLRAAGFRNDEWPVRIRLAFGADVDSEPSYS